MGGILDSKRLLSRNCLFIVRATFSLANNRNSAPSENSTDWKTAVTQSLILVSCAYSSVSLCHQSGDLTQLEEAINSDLKQLTTWLQGNKLSLNVAKTHSMLISTKQKHNILKSQNEVLELNIRNNKLDVVQKTKYLGVQIDSSLDWKEQIKVVSTKVSRAVGFQKHAKFFYQKKVW